MSVALNYDQEKKILFVTIKGIVTLEEFQSAMNQITRSEQYPPETNALWDLREMDFTEIDNRFWQGILEVRKQYPERKNARLAHVVDGEFAFGMMRMYEILSSLEQDQLTQQVRLFKSFEKGEQWLLSEPEMPGDE